MPTANDTTVKGHVLHHWDPENPEFWERTGARIARRNLWISIISLTLSFAIWVLWSVVTVRLSWSMNIKKRLRAARLKYRPFRAE